MRKENNLPQNLTSNKREQMGPMGDEDVLDVKNGISEIMASVEEIYDPKKRKEVLEKMLEKIDGVTESAPQKAEKEIGNNEIGNFNYPSLGAGEIDKKFTSDIEVEIEHTAMPKIKKIINTIQNSKIKTEVLENIISMIKGELEKVKTELEKLGK
ncbi:MAG: hypothetical protein PHE59_01530 [Patescibacteria group bacterium]|nr:hypothetical protein [Patescibacteria group bacterium]MDD5164025.1 hypothetical protein [Patescibacteria group bacterium]MDD5534891.1 hypothetical protein [Patescibacteria group bacterium]